MPEYNHSVGKVLPKRPRARDRFIQVSGTDQFGKPKTHVIFTFSERYSDGSSKVLQEVSVSKKPILSVFSNEGFVDVTMDFRSRDDVDLNLALQLIGEYQRPINSVDWLPEEIEQDFYIGEDGEQHLLYWPVLEVAISPLNKELEFMLTGINPPFFTLQPSMTTHPSGSSFEPCVLHFTFLQDWFTVSEDLHEHVDLDAMREEVIQELAMDMYSKYPNLEQ